MDPNSNDKFEQNLQGSIQSQPVRSSESPILAPKRRSFSRKYILILGVIIVAIIVLVSIYLLLGRDRSSQQVDSSTTTIGNNNVLIATVGDRDIYTSHVELVALEQHLPESINNEVLSVFIPITIERTILDIEAEKRGINIEKNNPVDYYNTLKELITQGEVQFVEAYDINWWIPPAPEYEQLPEFAEQRAITPQAVSDIVAGLRAGQQPSQIVNEIITRYPALRDIIGINGAQFLRTEDTTIFNSPRIHYQNQSDMSMLFFQELFEMNEGETEGFVWENGSGASIIQVVSVNKDGKVNYEQWLEQKNSELTTYNQDNIDLLL